MLQRFCRSLLAVVCAGFSIAATAEAAAVRSGSTIAAWIALTRGNAVAYDSINHVYLVVSAHGVVRGRFVSPNGTPLGTEFVVQGNPGLFGMFPRAAFSPDANGGAGGFLVTWSEADTAAGAFLHGRMVAFSQNGPFGADTVLSADNVWWEEAPYLAYSTTSKEFLAVYRTVATYVVRGVRVTNSATAAAAVFTISQVNQYEDNPSVAYNPVTNQYLVCWKGYNDPGLFGFVDCRFVASGANTLGAGPIRVRVAVATYITDTTYNPTTNQFLVSWRESTRTVNSTSGRLVNADGTMPGDVIAISTLWQAYDALGVAYNKLSRTFFAVSHDGRGCATCFQDGGVELADSGVPVDNGFVVTSAGKRGNFYPQIAAGEDDPNWLVSTATDFSQTSIQLIAGTASAGGPAPDPTPTPTPPTTPPPPVAPKPNPQMNNDLPAVNATVASNGFVIGGWALDAGATSGTGVDLIQVWAYPVGSSAGQFVGTPTYGIARPDVAVYFGSQFTNCGYTLAGSLPAPGAYDLYVFAHSSVTGSYSNVRIVRVNVVAPASRPAMWIDIPSANQTTSQNITVAGWAIDMGASTGTGVDTIHVWAYPTSGAPPVPVGIAQYGISRPDIGAYAGNSRFTPSGFQLTGTLAAGDYTLVVYAHSTVTNTFNNAMTVAIRVR